MQYAAKDVTPHERYKLLISFVLPRPIAWITTVGPTGVGEVGPTGAAGPTGSTGAQGAPGPTGVQGVAGASLT